VKDRTAQERTAQHSTPQHSTIKLGVEFGARLLDAFNTTRHRPVRDGLANTFPGILRYYRTKHAQHAPTSPLIHIPDDAQKQKLWKIQKVNNAVPAYIDLAVGTRVCCTQNLGTQIGNSVYMT
jgi:hypothetical protein